MNFYGNANPGGANYGGFVDDLISAGKEVLGSGTEAIEKEAKRQTQQKKQELQQQVEAKKRELQRQADQLTPGGEYTTQQQPQERTVVKTGAPDAQQFAPIAQNLTEVEVQFFQAYFNLQAGKELLAIDGIWGPNTQSAYEKYGRPYQFREETADPMNAGAVLPLAALWWMAS